MKVFQVGGEPRKQKPGLSILAEIEHQPGETGFLMPRVTRQKLNYLKSGYACRT